MAVTITKNEFKELVKELIFGIYYLKVSDGYIPGTLSYILSPSGMYNHNDIGWTDDDYRTIMVRDIYPFLIDDPEDVVFTFGWGSKFLTIEDLDIMYEQLENGDLSEITLSGKTVDGRDIEFSLTPDDTELIKEENVRLVTESAEHEWIIWGEYNINNINRLISD